jgi:hypothetical protein
MQNNNTVKVGAQVVAAAANEKSVRGSKRVYQKPELKIYGSVTALTQSGSANGREQGGVESNKSGQTSDFRVKENIQQIGQHPLGFGLYLFDYKSEFQRSCGEGRQFGVMAQEVELVVPAAVSIAANGYKQVDYRMLGIARPQDEIVH